LPASDLLSADSAIAPPVARWLWWCWLRSRWWKLRNILLCLKLSILPWRTEAIGKQVLCLRLNYSFC